MEKNEGRLSDTFESIRKLIQKGEVRVSEHGYDELLADGLLAREVVEGVLEAVVVEDYPTTRRVPVYSCFSEAGTINRSMSFGGSRKGTRVLRSL